MRTRVAAQPETFARATASASALTSVAHTSTCGSSAAIASAIAPEPVPMSATVESVGSDGSTSATRRRDRCNPARAASSNATSTTYSVSGLGMSTRAIDEEVEAPEPPLAQHVLQRLSPRPAVAPSRHLPLGARARRSDVGDREPLTGVVSRHVFEDEPNFGLGRPDARAGQVVRPSRAQLPPRHRASWSLAAELPGALVGRERFDHVVELAVEHAVE